MGMIRLKPVKREQRVPMKRRLLQKQMQLPVQITFPDNRVEWTVCIIVTLLAALFAKILETPYTVTGCEFAGRNLHLNGCICRLWHKTDQLNRDSNRLDA